MARSFWAVDALPKKDELVELPSSGLVGIASASSSTKTNGVIVIWSKKYSSTSAETPSTLVLRT